MRHSRATLQPLNVPQQYCATPLGNTLSLFRRRNIRIDPVMNKPGDTFGNAYTLGRHYKPISFHNSSARHPRATLCHFFVAETYALIPSRINSETPSALPTPLGDITVSKCSPTEPRGTLGRRYSPKTFPNSSARHPWATLCHFFVAETYALISSRISPETPSAPLGQRYKPTSRPQQNRTAPSGDIIMSRNELLTMEPLAVIAALKKANNTCN